MRAILARLAWLWCRIFHERISWPINGHYTCWECLRRHRVTWDEPTPGIGLRRKHHHWDACYRNDDDGRLEGV